MPPDLYLFLGRSTSVSGNSSLHVALAFSEADAIEAMCVETGAGDTIEILNYGHSNAETVSRLSLTAGVAKPLTVDAFRPDRPGRGKGKSVDRIRGGAVAPLSAGYPAPDTQLERTHGDEREDFS